MKRKKKAKNWLLLIGMIATLGAWMIHLSQDRLLDQRVRSLILTIQQGVQRYHVAEEAYPPKSMSGIDLIKLLQERGELSDALANPWASGARFSESPTPNGIAYETDIFAESFAIIATDPETGDVLYRLDSSENPSLE